MQVRDIMTSPAITVAPDTTVGEIAQLLMENRISAVPVVGNDGEAVGIVSEGDLMRRPEAGTERQPSWWLAIFGSNYKLARQFAKAHGQTAADVMTADVVTTTEDADIGDIAELLERARIKRVPVVRDGRVVGIVSRANLLQALATSRPQLKNAPPDESKIRAAVLSKLAEASVSIPLINVTVSGQEVHLWGAVESEDERRALRVAAEEAAQGLKIVDHLGHLSPMARSTLWAE